MQRDDDKSPLVPGWWILPGTFVAIWLWIGLFKLIGVL